jgi:hypothetical protein
MSETHTTTVSNLGGPGPADPATCSSCAVVFLARAAGEGMRMTSLEMDVTSNAIGDHAVAITTQIDKRAKSIVFASLEARADGVLVFRAQGLFSKAS